MTAIFDIVWDFGWRLQGEDWSHDLSPSTDKAIGQMPGDKIEVSTEPLPGSRHFKQIRTSTMSGFYQEQGIDCQYEAKACLGTLEIIFGTVPTDIYIRKLNTQPSP